MVAHAMSQAPRLSGQTAAGDRAARPRGAGRAAAARRLLVMAILAVALTTAVLAVPTLGSVRAALDAINGWWAATAVALEVASCASFVLVFRAFFGTVTPRIARRVAWVEEGSGALLPGGGRRYMRSRELRASRGAAPSKEHETASFRFS